MSEVYNAGYWENPNIVPNVSYRSTTNPNEWRITDNNYGYDTWYTIKFPDEVNEDTRIIIACGGAGGWGDQNSVISKNTNQNAIVIIPQYQHNDNYRAVIRMANELASDDPRFRDQLAAQGVKITGVPSNSCVTFGAHSNSSKEIVSVTVNYLTNEHANGRETRAAVLINDAEHTSLVGYGSVKNSYEAHKGELDDSLIFATTQEYYLRESENGGLVANRGYGPESYLGDLEDMARAGATVMLTTYDIRPLGWKPKDNSKNWHTESVEMTSAMGLFDLERGTLENGPFSFASERNGGKDLSAELKFYFFDVEKDSWVAYPSVVEAQAQLDISTAKVALYNSGFLSKADGQYTVKLGGTEQQVSKSDLDAYLLACKTAYKESGNTDQSFEDFCDEYAKDHPIMPNNDNVPPTLEAVGIAVDAIKASYESIGGHVKSFGNIPGLSVKPEGELSDYLKSMNAFPSGVGTSGLESCLDGCISKLEFQMSEAYNTAANLYNVMAEAEGQNGSYYEPASYNNAGNSANTDATNFANDVD